VHVLVETLLENATAKIVTLAFHHFGNSLTKLSVGNPSFPGRLGKPGSLEDSGFQLSPARFGHCITPGVMEVKA
jgi:hypothetical protein